MDNSLHDLVENYAEMMPKLRGKTRHPAAQNWPRREAPRPILRAACDAAPLFPRNFGVIVYQIVRRFVYLP